MIEGSKQPNVYFAFKLQWIIKHYFDYYSLSWFDVFNKPFTSLDPGSNLTLDQIIEWGFVLIPYSVAWF